MYHYTIAIHVVGENVLLKNVMEALPPAEYLDWTVTWHKRFVPDIVDRADVIIFTCPEDFQAARACARQETYLVACLSSGEEAALSDENRNALDDIWLAPFSESRIRMRVTHLLAEINGGACSAFCSQCLDTFINCLPDMVWFKDMEGRHRKVNDYFCQFVGKTREEIENKTHEDIWGVSENDGEFNCHETDQAALATGETVTAEEVVQTGDGKRLFKTIKTPVRGLDGEILGTAGIAHDITNLFNLNIELDLFIEVMPFPLMICGFDEQVAKVNARFLEFFETDIDSIAGICWRDWYEQNILHEISPTGEEIYMRFIHADGHMSFLKMISHDLNDIFGNYQGVIHVFEDVTDEKELEYNIWKLANTDALTGLANRQAFYEYAKRIDINERVHLFYVDLDNFKQVNDNFGHKAGDEALKVTAMILRQVFGKDFPARLGGDEFIVCVRREATLQDLEAMAQSLIDLMQEKFSASEILNRLSCSVGVSVNGSMRNGIEPLIKITDRAMYDAKNQGKSRYCICQNSDEQS